MQGVIGMSNDRCARTWQISRSTSGDVNRLANELECYPSDLVDLLLRRALVNVDRGVWEIERKPYKYTLHWGQGGSSGTKA